MLIGDSMNELFKVFDDARPFHIPERCTLVHAEEFGDEIVGYSFVTDWGVINTYEKNDKGQYNIVSVQFPDGYFIDVDALLEEK